MPIASTLNGRHLTDGDQEPKSPDNGVFRLYSMRYCPYAQRCIMYMAKKQIPIEIININLTDKPKWYSEKVNPTGQVPTLEHDGKKIYESTVIPTYLDELFPGSSILPKDPYERAQQKILAERLSAVIDAFNATRLPTTDPAVLQQNKAKMTAVFDKAEKLLKEKFFGGKKTLNDLLFTLFFGKNIGYADYMIWPWFERLQYTAKLQPNEQAFEAKDFPGTKQYPKLSAWIKAMIEQPEVKLTHIPTDIIRQFREAYRAGKTKYDYDEMK